MGNICSVASAIEYLGLASCLSSDREIILEADFIILPGVGSFNLAMQKIRQLKLYDTLRCAGLDRKIPMLGICLGMQLLAMSGTEDGFTEGLGLIDGNVERFNADTSLVKVPHVGFSTTNIVSTDSPLFRGLPQEVDFYYTHSYRMICSTDCLLATGCNGETFAAAVGKNNIYGTQFHPEMSQANGLHLLKNFFSECG